MLTKLWIGVGAVVVLLFTGALLRELLPSHSQISRSSPTRHQETDLSPPVAEPLSAPSPLASPKAPVAAARRSLPSKSADARESAHVPFRTGGPEDAQSFADEFAKESVDVAWARETREALDVGLKPLENEQAKVERIECKDKLCRIDAEFADNDSRMKFLRKGFLMAKESAMFSINSEIYAPPPSKTDDGISGSVYVIRP